MHPTAEKMLEFFREQGQAGKSIVINLTPEDKRRNKEVHDFIKKLDDAYKATKNSKLYFGGYYA